MIPDTLSALVVVFAHVIERMVHEVNYTALLTPP